MRHREWSIRFSSPSLGPFPLPLPRNMLVHIVEIVQVCPMCTYLTDLLYLKKPGPSIKWKKKKKSVTWADNQEKLCKNFWQRVAGPDSNGKIQLWGESFPSSLPSDSLCELVVPASFIFPHSEVLIFTGCNTQVSSMVVRKIQWG